ncbi:hypothetical protein ACKWTF_000255 [Chironomus riparius]
MESNLILIITTVFFSTFFLSMSTEDTTEKVIKIINDDKPKQNVYELYQKVENDLANSQIYMLKEINTKIDDLEERLMKKFEKDLMENEGTILKLLENRSIHHSILH